MNRDIQVPSAAEGSMGAAAASPAACEAAAGVVHLALVRSVGHEQLLASYQKTYGPVQGEIELSNQFAAIFEEARTRAGVATQSLARVPGAGHFTTGVADDAEALAAAMIEITAEQNASIPNEQLHKRIVAGIVAFPGAAAAAGRAEDNLQAATASYQEADELTRGTAAGEIRLTDSVYQCLSGERRALYERVNRQPVGRVTADRVTPAPVWRRHATAAGPARGGADACVLVVDMARFSRVQTNMTLLMGPAGSVALAEQINGIVGEGFKRAGAGSCERYMYKFGGDGGIFFFNDPALAHRVAVEILNQAEERNKKCREQAFEDGMRCFRIGIDFGRVERDGRNEFSGPPIARATRLEGGGPSGEIRTSAEFYRQLPTELRKAYGDEEPILGKDHDAAIAGRRLAVTARALWPELGPDNLPYPKPKQPNSEFYVPPAPKESEPCFVVCPLSAGQGRVGRVFDELIAPACERAGFNPRRANELPGDRKQVIAENLAGAPLVIAYLGNPATGWNSNVILEVGFRLATGMPLVMISDADADGREPEYQRLLPFQIAHHNVITVGTDPAQKLETLYEEIAENRGAKPASEWESPNAVIEFKFTRITDVLITDANEAARQLFGTENVRKNQGVEKLRTAFAARTDQVQADARRAEQVELLTRLWQRSTFGDTVQGWRVPRARIPIVFKDAPIEPESGKPMGYLPVILRYDCEHDVTRVRYMYLRVSASMTMDEKAGYYVCDL